MLQLSEALQWCVLYFNKYSSLETEGPKTRLPDLMANLMTLEYHEVREGLEARAFQIQISQIKISWKGKLWKGDVE